MIPSVCAIVQVRVGTQSFHSPGVAVYEYSKPVNLPPILAGVLVPLVVIVVVILLVCWWKRQKKSIDKDYRSK